MLKLGIMLPLVFNFFIIAFFISGPFWIYLFSTPIKNKRKNIIFNLVSCVLWFIGWLLLGITFFSLIIGNFRHIFRGLPMWLILYIVIGIMTIIVLFLIFLYAVGKKIRKAFNKQS